MRHILVTGGAGFVGSHLVERLLADGRAVVVVDDLSTGCLENLRAVQGHPRLRILPSKVSTCSQLTELVAQADSIYHLAAAVGWIWWLSRPFTCWKPTCTRRRCCSKPPWHTACRCS